MCFKEVNSIFSLNSFPFVSPKALDSGHELTGFHLTFDVILCATVIIVQTTWSDKCFFFLSILFLTFSCFFIYIFFLHLHLYFCPHFICNGFFTLHGNSARHWCICIARTKLIIQAHKTLGGQHVLWQTTSWVTCSKG